MEEEEEEAEENATTCLAPHITHFPDPLIRQEARRKGAVILHILVAVYVFLGELRELQ